jgi:hypothetical protein
MKFKTQLNITVDEIAHSNSDYVFVGASIDDRSALVIDKLQNSVFKKLVKIKFDAEDMSFDVDGKIIKFMMFSQEMDSLTDNELVSSITLDATSLGVVEILYILRWFKRKVNNADINILYAEPAEYPSKLKFSNEFGKHQFNLSNSSIGYKSLPGFTKTAPSSEKIHVIALLGFERVRLGQLIQNDEGAYIDSITPIFGVPGFKPSYDKHSAFQNINILLEKGRKPMFSSANNPYDTFKVLNLLKQSMPDEVINIAPIGTKPMAIGACIFLLNNLNKNIGILYDHPNKTSGRTKGISNVHRYTLSTEQ